MDSWVKEELGLDASARPRICIPENVGKTLVDGHALRDRPAKLAAVDMGAEVADVEMVSPAGRTRVRRLTFLYVEERFRLADEPAPVVVGHDRGTEYEATITARVNGDGTMTVVGEDVRKVRPICIPENVGKTLANRQGARFVILAMGNLPGDVLLGDADTRLLEFAASEAWLRQEGFRLADEPVVEWSADSAEVTVSMGADELAPGTIEDYKAKGWTEVAPGVMAVPRQHPPEIIAAKLLTEAFGYGGAAVKSVAFDECADDPAPIIHDDKLRADPKTAEVARRLLDGDWFDDEGTP